MVGLANDLNIQQAGYVVHNGMGVFRGNTFQAGPGITISNANGVSGNTTISAIDGGMITVNVDNGGSVTGNTLQLYANSVFSNSGSTVKFIAANATEIDFTVTDLSNNTIIGHTAGNSSLTATQCTGLGRSSLNALTSGGNNNSFGFLSLTNVTSGFDNSGFGSYTLQNVVSGTQNSAFGSRSLLHTTGSNNSAFGFYSLINMIGGSYNTCVGFEAGQNYAGSESSNIILGANSGVLSESNVMRIGGGTGSGTGQQNISYISGINGNTVASSNVVTINSSTDQMGVVTNGTTGQVLAATTGASPTFQNVPFTPNAILNEFDDFIGSQEFLPQVSKLQWNLKGSHFHFQNGTAANPGIIQLSPAINETQYICLDVDDNAGVYNGPFVLGGGTLSFSWVAQLSALSAGGNTYTACIGMADNITIDNSSISFVNGIYFQYTDTINSGNWTVNCTNASTTTTSNTTVAADTNFHNFTIKVNAGGTSVSFYIDTVLAATAITTHIPTTAITPFIELHHTAGTSPPLNIDLYYMTYTLTTPR